MRSGVADDGFGRLADAVLLTATRELRDSHANLSSERTAATVEAVLDGDPTWGQYARARCAYARWREAREFFLRDSRTSSLATHCGLVGYEPDVVRAGVAGHMNLPWNGRLLQAALDRYKSANSRATRRARAASAREGRVYTPEVIEELRELRALGHSWQRISRLLNVHSSNLRKAFSRYGSAGA